MTAAAELRKEFQEYMDEHELTYRTQDVADNRVFVRLDNEEFRTWAIVDFDEEEEDDADSVHVVTLRYAKVTKPDEALARLNEINRKYRWVKTYMDTKGYICSDMDAYVFPGSVGTETVRMAFHMATITEKILIDLEGVATPDHEFEQALSKSL